MNLDARTRALALCERARVAGDCSLELAAASAEQRLVAQDRKAAAQQTRLTTCAATDRASSSKEATS